MKNNLKNSILKKIETENIQPQSKWYFRAQNWSFWAFFFGALIIGSASFALIIFALKNTDFELLEYLGESEGFTRIITLLPLLWIFAIGVAVGIGIWGLKNTKRGYKLALVTLVIGNILGSMFFGSLVYGAGGGEYIEDLLEDRLPTYQGVREKHQRFWGHPEKTGRLAGLVESIDTENETVTLSDPNGRTWIVDTRDKNKDFQVGAPIKMRGNILTDGSFLPQHIRPAFKQHPIHRKIQQHFKKNPELKKQRIQKLDPQLQEKIREAHSAGRRPSRELRHEIRENIKKNTTPQERIENRATIQKILQNSPSKIQKDFREHVKPKTRLNPEIKKQLKHSLTTTKPRAIRHEIQQLIPERKAHIKPPRKTITHRINR